MSLKNINKYDIWTAIALWAMFMVPVLAQNILYQKDSPAMGLLIAVAAIPLVLMVAAIGYYWVFVLVSIPLMYFSGNETFVVVVYQNYMRAANVISMFITTSNESGSFVSNNLTTCLWDVPVIVFWIVSLWTKWKALNALPKGTGWRYLKCTVAAVVIFLLCAVPVGGVKSLLLQPPYNLPGQFMRAYLWVQEKKAVAPESRNMSFDATHNDSPEREIYVMSIGESLRYDRLSLSGYGRKTTPGLDSTANVVLYPDYYSNSTLTMLSAPMMLSRATADDFFCAYRQKNMLAAFKECGFRVFVLVHLNHLDTDSYLTCDADSVFHLSSDMDFSHVIDSIASVPENRKLFFVTQGLGSHGYYYNFEEEDNLFGQNPYFDYKGQANANTCEQLSNAYDCTVHYTDRVMKGVIQALKRDSTMSVLLYASDHGENLEDGAEKRSVSMHPKATEYHVPMIFWYNSSWAGNNPDKLHNMLEHKQKPVSADNLFYTMLDLADVQISKQYSAPQMSIASSVFQVQKRRLLCPDGKTVMPQD